MHPYDHARSSARIHGGVWQDYFELHSWFDASKSLLCRFTHRALRHHLEGVVAHMGGELFVVLLKLEDYERFCSSLASEFDQRSRTLYTPKEVEQGYFVATDKRGQEVRCPLLALSIGVAHTQFRNFKSAKKMFEVLAQVRQMAQPSKSGSVIFVDRRHADR